MSNIPSVPACFINPISRCFCKISRNPFCILMLRLPPPPPPPSSFSSSPLSLLAAASCSFLTTFSVDGQFFLLSAFQASISAFSASFIGGRTTGSWVTGSRGGTMSFLRCLLLRGGIESDGLLLLPLLLGCGGC